MIDPNVSEVHLTSSQLKDIQHDVGFHWDDNILPMWAGVKKQEKLSLPAFDHIRSQLDPEFRKVSVELHGVNLNRAWMSANLGYGRIAVKRSPCSLCKGGVSGVVGLVSVFKKGEC